jgi:hypothetical protein
MRDNHADMIELLDASNANNIYSTLIEYQVDGEMLRLRFGMSKTDYYLLKRILEFRPYENTGVAPYRYFFVLSYHNDPENENLAFTAVRVEQLKQHKQHDFHLTKKLIANILWFNRIEDRKDVEHLIEKNYTQHLP